MNCNGINVSICLVNIINIPAKICLLDASLLVCASSGVGRQYMLSHKD